MSGEPMMKKFLHLAVFLLLSPVAIPAAQGSSGSPPASKPPTNGATNPVKSNAVPATTDPAYVIGPQDMLDITVWKEPEVSRTVPVRPDGRISLPLIHDLQAAGLTPMQLNSSITEKLSKFVKDPQVTVIVTQINSQRVFILGEVNHAGAIPLLPGMTVLQALSNAGGFSEFANLKGIYVTRMENGTPVKYPFNYKKVIKGQDTSQNIILKPGDTIIVP